MDCSFADGKGRQGFGVLRQRRLLEKWSTSLPVERSCATIMKWKRLETKEAIINRRNRQDRQRDRESVCVCVLKGTDDSW